MREGRTWRLSTDKASEEFAGVCQKNGAQLGGRGGTGRARGQERTKTIKTEELVTWFCDGGDGPTGMGWWLQCPGARPPPCFQLPAPTSDCELDRNLVSRLCIPASTSRPAPPYLPHILCNMVFRNTRQRGNKIQYMTFYSKSSLFTHIF